MHPMHPCTFGYNTIAEFEQYNDSFFMHNKVASLAHIQINAAHALKCC